MRTSSLLRIVRHRATIMPASPLCTRRSHTNPSYWTSFRYNENCNLKPLFYANPLIQKNIESDITFEGNSDYNG